MTEIIVRKTTAGYVIWGSSNEVYLCKSFRELIEKQMEIFGEVKKK